MFLASAMLIYTLLSLLLPFLTETLSIISPTAGQTWDIAHDQILFSEYNISDPIEIAFAFVNSAAPYWSGAAGVDPSELGANRTFKTDVQHALLTAVWFAKVEDQGLPLNHYNNAWEIQVFTSELPYYGEAPPWLKFGLITIINSRRAADANATHLSPLRQHFGTLDTPPSSIRPWYLWFGIASGSCILIILCGEAVGLILKRRIRKPHLKREDGKSYYMSHYH